VEQPAKANWRDSLKNNAAKMGTAIKTGASTAGKAIKENKLASALGAAAVAGAAGAIAAGVIADKESKENKKLKAQMRQVESESISGGLDDDDGFIDPRKATTAAGVADDDDDDIFTFPADEDSLYGGWADDGIPYDLEDADAFDQGDFEGWGQDDAAWDDIPRRGQWNA
jgi:hypothetical protein